MMMAQDNLDMAKNYAKITDDLATLKNDLAGVIKLFEKQGMDQVKSTLNSVKDSVKGSCDLHKMEDCIKKNPKESIFVALAAGVVLACLLGRK